MFRGRLVVQALFLFLCVGISLSRSDKKHENATHHGIHLKRSPVATEESSSLEEPQESKPKPRFSTGHSSGGDQYILEEDEGHVVGEDDGEFVEEEGREEDYGQEQERGYRNDDKKVDDETQKDFKQTGSYQDFSQGGAVFDKHHKDHMAENKENEDIKQHDAGEKFGAEALKEHKLGKHKEKSKGHKKYGFKNVYHKEEYGDHKTFHDEFLDNDHFHDYDDKHEHKQMQGGRFAKGYKREGENKEHDVGDEKHAWGKAGHDGKADGYYEKGGHLSGHHHGHKKQEGHYDANSRHAKKSAHKLKKGDVPVVSSVYHQDVDKPQYYSQVHHAHDPVHFAHAHGETVIPEHHHDGYHGRHNGAHYDQSKAVKVHGNKVLHSTDILPFHEPRSANDARRLEVTGNERYSEKEYDQDQEPVKENRQYRENVPSTTAPKIHSYHYVRPDNDQSLPKEDRISKYRHQHGLSEPLKYFHHQKPSPAGQLSKPEFSDQHFVQNPRSSQHIAGDVHVERNLHHHQPRGHSHRHFLIRPHHQQDSHKHHHHQTDDQVSKPYPWWEASSTARKHHQSRDFHPAPSYQHYGYADVPEKIAPRNPRRHHLMEEHEPSASQHRPGYARQPRKIHWKRVKSHHHHN